MLDEEEAYLLATEYFLWKFDMGMVQTTLEIRYFIELEKMALEATGGGFMSLVDTMTANTESYK